MPYRSDYYDNDNYDPQDERCGSCPTCDGDVFWPDPDRPARLANGLLPDGEGVGDCPYCDALVVFTPYSDDTPEAPPAPEPARPLGILAPPTIEEMMAYYDDPVRQRLDSLHNDSHDLRKDQWKERFALIREAYTLLMPSIMEQARYAKTINPYFIEWDWSPIEYNAWCEIRGLALPFYPQVPVAGFFLDFADPYRKICIELDGKEFHDAEKDAKRDAVLSKQGWEVFRISGKMANTYMANELPEHLARVDEDGADSQDVEEERRDWDDTLRRTTIDGFFKWLKGWFYTREDIAEAANPTPDEDEEWEEEGGTAL